MSNMNLNGAGVRRFIVKLGTNVLTGGSDYLNRPRIVELVRQIAAARDQGIDVILVSSGAVAAGREQLQFPPRRRDMPLRQLLAAVGQSRLMHLYGQIFDLYSIPVAQTLLTRDDLRDRYRYLNARNTLQACLAHQVLPIINENDVVAVNTMRVGDNDMLSALVANLLDADLLLILSDVDGVYTDDPRCNPQAQRIPEIPKITEVTYALAGDSNTRGTGGMFTKIQAADLATRSGIAVVIASGYEPDIIRRVLQGEQLGTRFFPTTTSLESRKRWILAETVRHSCIVIDDGATDALTGSGKSLLSAGIMAIEGEFGRGQTVRIYSKTRREIARGLVRYNSSDLQLIKGLQSTQIADILGYHYGPEIVHRDDMVIL
ncbi:MAG: glutamate 5-kinase [Chloroflexi bacterium AL-W]|nr:glutamate 5-kinase [Chloroflexi bacterium AL-N1]NOK65772.1 glutamate 5-kinase [Chloroflexi bacterium AL-N10]NOK74287.1 glutamate 5-kinase [Chloroflexi bacterium AL-N5]NOK80805.1 glutamate 5-kinase [Chloroflexi bacterium AL-W]NOK88545.1 glutamate 5-kinase [Chloroflexi bacterium AL-N15]